MSDDSVSAALRSDAQLVVVEAPAGCGKTHQGADYAREIALAARSDRPTALRHPSAGTIGYRRLDRGLLQSIQTAFLDRLSDVGRQGTRPQGPVGRCTRNRGKVKAWLLALTTREFEEWVSSEIEKWFESPPDWAFEDDYLPQSGTAQGAAMEFFQSMDVDQLETLGVEVVEGEHPGSTYYAAELRNDIDQANRAAQQAGISVRFVAAKN